MSSDSPAEGRYRPTGTEREKLPRAMEVVATRLLPKANFTTLMLLTKSAVEPLTLPVIVIVGSFKSMRAPARQPSNMAMSSRTKVPAVTDSALLIVTPGDQLTPSSLDWIFTDALAFPYWWNLPQYWSCGNSTASLTQPPGFPEEPSSSPQLVIRSPLNEPEAMSKSKNGAISI